MILTFDMVALLLQSSAILTIFAQLFGQDCTALENLKWALKDMLDSYSSAYSSPAEYQQDTTINVQ